VRPSPRVPGSGPHHRRPGWIGRLPADRRGGGEERRRRGPTRPAPAPVGGARRAAETIDGAGREGRPPRLAKSSAVEEGLNEPGPGPLIGTIRITSPDCVFCVLKCTPGGPPGCVAPVGFHLG